MNNKEKNEYKHDYTPEVLKNRGIGNCDAGLRAGAGICSRETEKALEYLHKASEMITEFGTTEAEPEVLSGLSEVWLGKGDPLKANEFCERLLTIAGKEGLKKYLAIAKRIKGELLLSKTGGSPTAELMEKAATELKEARRIAEEIGALPLLWQTYGSLGVLYQKKGDKRKATEQFKSTRKIIREIASKVSDEKLKNVFLNSKQVQSLPH